MVVVEERKIPFPGGNRNPAVQPVAPRYTERHVTCETLKREVLLSFRIYYNFVMVYGAH
jgi:hypothetical protein